MQCCGKRGITSRVINPLRVAASQQADTELHLILASIEVATVAVPIYFDGLLLFSMSDICSVAAKMKLVTSSLCLSSDFFHFYRPVYCQ